MIHKFLLNQNIPLKYIFQLKNLISNLKFYLEGDRIAQVYVYNNNEIKLHIQ